MQYGAEDVEDIPKQPDDDEDEGERIGGGAPEIFDYLRGEDDDPAGYGDGAAGEVWLVWEEVLV